MCVEAGNLSASFPGVGPRNLSDVPEVDEISLVWTGNGILCSKISETADLVELNQSLNFEC